MAAETIVYSEANSADQCEYGSGPDVLGEVRAAAAHRNSDVVKLDEMARECADLRAALERIAGVDVDLTPGAAYAMKDAAETALAKVRK